MAQYKYGEYLNKSDNDAYDTIFEPGTVVTNSGIYRCVNCGDEIAANKNNPLPPQNHHQHPQTTLPIRWKLLVFAQQKK